MLRLNDFFFWVLFLQNFVLQQNKKEKTQVFFLFVLLDILEETKFCKNNKTIFSHKFTFKNPGHFLNMLKIINNNWRSAYFFLRFLKQFLEFTEKTGSNFFLNVTEVGRDQPSLPKKKQKT